MNADKTARSAQSSRGWETALRSTATSWRRTSNSTSLAADERPSNTSQPTSRTEIKYSSRNDTRHDHCLIFATRRSSQVTSTAGF